MSNIQSLLAKVVGVVLTLVGIAGFFTGSTFLGFGVNTLHNIAHLLLGAAGLWVGFSAVQYAKPYNQWTGVIYLLLAALGFFVPELMVTLLNANMADNILHLVLGIVLAGVGFGVKE